MSQDHWDHVTTMPTGMPDMVTARSVSVSNGLTDTVPHTAHARRAMMWRMTTTPAAPGRRTVTISPQQVGVIVAGALLGALLIFVGGIALVDSYWHARLVAHEYGAHLGMGPDMARWRPLTTDGLLLAVFAVIYWRRITSKPVHWLVWVAAGLAAAGTLAANLVAGQHDIGGFIVSAWAPLTMVVVDFLVALFVAPLVAAWKAGRTPTAPPAATPAAPAAAVEPALPAEPNAMAHVDQADGTRTAVPVHLPDREKEDLTQVPWTGSPVGPVGDARRPATEPDDDPVPALTDEDYGALDTPAPPTTPRLRPVPSARREGEAVSVVALTGRATTSALSTATTAPVGVRWTEDDQAKLDTLQREVDGGGLWPTPNSMKTRAIPRACVRTLANTSSASVGGTPSSASSIPAR